MWWRADAADLHRVEDRVSTLYAERCHVDRDENAVVFVNKQRTVRLPAAMIGALLLGPGSRITHGAMNLLGDSGTSVCWVGEHGVRLYSAGMGPSRGAQVVQRQAYLVSHPSERLQVARQMFSMRFDDVDVSSATMQQLRGFEGARVKKVYRAQSERTGVPWDRRAYKAGDAFGAGDDVNRLLSAANSALYGACHAAIVGVGASPALGFVHVGSALSFVLDIADLYKAEYSIPLAFELAAAGHVDEADARWALRDRFAADKFMARVVRDIIKLIMGADAVMDADQRRLWDEVRGTVEGGHNWDAEAAWFIENADYATLSGPQLEPNEVPF